MKIDFYLYKFLWVYSFMSDSVDVDMMIWKVLSQTKNEMIIFFICFKN